MTLLKHLEIISDPRTDINIKHNLIDVVFLTLSAILSGATGWKSIEQFGIHQLDWLRLYRPFEHGIPRRHCIANIIKSLDSELLLQAIFGWLNDKRLQTGKPIIALDGKTMRRAWADDIHQALHIVSAFDVRNGMALYLEAAEKKGHEAAIARDIIDALALDNAVVTLDTLHCQKATMDKIISKKSDFVIQIKGNQPALLAAVKAAFAACYDSPALAISEQTNTGHGRKECRRVMQIEGNLPPELSEKWPHIRTLVEVASERTVGNKTACSSRWYVSSLPVDTAQLADIIRAHWAIENQLHWVLDVVFREDELNVSDPDGAKHLALFNRAALSVIKQHQGKKDSLAAKRQSAAWDPAFRSELLFG